MGELQLRGIVLQILERQPGLIFDLLEEDPPHPAPPPAAGSPEWCICNNCQDMPSDVERLCCRCLPQNCISDRPVCI